VAAKAENWSKVNSFGGAVIGQRHLYESIDEGRPGDDGDYIPKDFADWRQIPSEALEQKELRDALTKALNSLPEKYRTVLILRDVQHLSITEAAQILGITEAKGEDPSVPRPAANARRARARLRRDHRTEIPGGASHLIEVKRKLERGVLG
jgi:hypothetical protein